MNENTQGGSAERGERTQEQASMDWHSENKVEEEALAKETKQVQPDKSRDN